MDFDQEEMNRIYERSRTPGAFLQRWVMYALIVIFFTVFLWVAVH